MSDYMAQKMDEQMEGAHMVLMAAEARAEAAEAEVLTLRALCAAAYQVVGAADGPVEMLDNLSAAGNAMPLPHKPHAGLPWAESETEKDARRYRWLRKQNADLDPNSFLVLHSDEECRHCDGTWVGADLDAAIDAELAKAPNMENTVRPLGKPEDLVFEDKPSKEGK